MTSLRFTPYAWSKLLFLRDYGKTEVGMMGLSDPEDLLLVYDVALVEQKCTGASTDFDEDGIADFFDEQVEQGRKPEEFGRIWIHTHPGFSAKPSGMDEDTFKKTFSKPDWAVMAIVADDGDTYARLRYNTGPRGAWEIPVKIEYDCDYDCVDDVARSEWEEEYNRTVTEEMYGYGGNYNYKSGGTATNQHKAAGTQPRFADPWWTVNLESGLTIQLQAPTFDEAKKRAEAMDKNKKAAVAHAEQQQAEELLAERNLLNKDQTDLDLMSDEEWRKTHDTDPDQMETVAGLDNLPDGWEDWTDKDWDEYAKQCDMEDERRIAEEDAAWEIALAEEADQNGKTGFSDYNASDSYFLTQQKGPAVNGPDI